MHKYDRVDRKIKQIQALITAQRALEGWTGDTSYDELYALLGYGTPPLNLSKRDVRVLELLAGPDGYTVYRVLLARKDR
jgi:hypothetical protein